MRECDREEVWLSLVNRSPDEPTEKRKHTKQRIGKVDEAKQQGDYSHTPPSSPDDDLSTTVQKPLKNVLLKQGPEWDQQESPAQRLIGNFEA